MELNQTTLRGILAAVLSVNPDHVVPKQGNWWNPQENKANIKNWCAYNIRSNKPRTVPFYTKEDQTNCVCVSKIAEIDLQFVGPDSEDIAQSIAAWPLRSDVQQQLQTVQGALLHDDLTATSSIFYQDGNNTVLAWNVHIRVNWISITETNQGPMQQITLNGSLNK